MRAPASSIRRRTAISRAVASVLGPLCLSAVGALIVMPASAQQQVSAAAEGGTASETASSNVIVVTGTAAKKTQVQASYSITTVDAAALRLRAPTSVTEALKVVPGFWVEASGGEASGNIRARGIPVDGFGSVTLLEDGIPVQHDPALGYLNADQVFRLDETINRIEVVRGGPSALFYSNAPAGAVNFRSRDIGSKAEGTLKVTLSDHGQRRGDFWYGTPVSDSLKVAVGGFYRTEDGIRNPGFTANKGGQIRLKAVKDVDNGRLTADFKHLDDIVEFYLGLPMRTYPDGSIKAVPGIDGNYATIAGPQTAMVKMVTGNNGVYLFDNTEGTHVKRDQLSLGAEFDLPAQWLLKDSFRYSDTHTIRNGVYPNQLISINNFLLGSAPLLARLPGATAFAIRSVDAPGVNFVGNGNGLMVVGGLRGITMPVQETVNDLRLTRKFTLGDQVHQLTAGYYYAGFKQGFQRYSSTALLAAQSQAPLLNLVGVNAAGTVVGTITDGGIYNYGYEWANASGKSSTHSLYVSDDWKVTDRLTVDGGARFERVNVSGTTERTKVVDLGTFATSAIKTGAGIFDSYDQSFNKTGWSLGTNYQWSDGMGVFARWSQAFRLPNLSSYITSPTATPRTQTMELGEIGFKLASEFIDVYPTFFFTRYHNVSYTNYVFSLNNASSTPETGYADSKASGLELDSTVRFNRMFDLGVVLTAQDPKYDNLVYTDKVNNLPVQRDFRGKQLIRVPRTSYRLTPGVNLMGDALRLQLSYEYVGERFVDIANTVKLPSYSVLNFAARYQVGKSTSVYFNVDNINNSQGLTEGNPRAGELQSADAGANSFIARPILGRNVRVSVKYDF